MAEEKETNEKKETEEIEEEGKGSDNVVLKKFQKEQTRDQKNKKWRQIDDAVSAARRAYMGGFEADTEEKTVSFDKAVSDLVEVLQKIKGGEINLGGLGEEGSVELSAEA